MTTDEGAWAVTLWFEERGGRRRWIELHGNDWTIGRVQDNAICIPRGNLSKRHQKLCVREGKLILLDMKSTNGSYLDGRRISGPTIVRPQSRGYVGDFTWGIAKPPVRIDDDAAMSAVWTDQQPADAVDEHDVAFGDVFLDVVPDPAVPMEPFPRDLAQALLAPLLHETAAPNGTVTRASSVRATTAVFMGGDIGSAAVAGAINELAAVYVPCACVELDLVVAGGTSLQVVRRVLRSACATARKAKRPVVAARAHVVSRGGVDDVLLVATARGTPNPSWPALHSGLPPDGAPVVVTQSLGAHGAALLGADVPSDLAPVALAWTPFDAPRAAPLHREGGLRAACAALAGDHAVIELDEARVPLHHSAAGFARAHGVDPLALPSAGLALILDSVRGDGGAQGLAALRRTFPDAAIVGRVVAV